ncbi:protein LTV1 homolog [Microplitis demolitor]|uniref:protein LTV1 homolog n=1 Tax=Microplitis demolitor TaxID=69319 RepID=UPI0004CDA5E7|nr:protein LTV1 homolog [Microplitis demolitor]
MPKKKFIDKKNAASFLVGHRSQKDPLAADENAPQHVLVPIDSKKAKEKCKSVFEDEFAYLRKLEDVNNLPQQWAQDQPGPSSEDRPKINLPSSVLPSSVEEKTGLLNRAAPISGPRPELDPDIVAALDDDFDFEDSDNELEDDFIKLANGDNNTDYFNEEDEYDESDISSNFMVDSDEERDEVCSLDGPQFTFKDEETKSRFTEYSMSSSVMRRNEQLSHVDDKFEKMYADYDDEQIGALDCEEIEGHVDDDSSSILKLAMEFQKQREESTVSISELMKDRLKIIEINSSSEGELEEVEVDERRRNKWDCESILSTHSNIFNHPKLLPDPKRIGKIKIDKRTGIPKNVLNDQPGKLTAKNLVRLGLENEDERNLSYSGRSIAETNKSYYSMISIRPKNETREEKKERRKRVKEHRRARRIECKENKNAFKEEKKRQEKILLNNNRNKLIAPNTQHI